MARKFRSLPQTAPIYFRFYQIHTPSILFVIHHISHNLITPQWFPLPYKSFLSAPESMLIISHIPCVFSQFYIINNPSCFYVSITPAWAFTIHYLKHFIWVPTFNIFAYNLLQIYTLHSCQTEQIIMKSDYISLILKILKCISIKSQTKIPCTFPW